MLALVCISAVTSCASSAADQSFTSQQPESAISSSQQVLSQLPQGAGGNRATCVFEISGAGSQTSDSEGIVVAASISDSPPSSPTASQSGLVAASISCSADASVSMTGGTAYESFAKSWTGVTFKTQTNIAAMTLQIQDINLLIIDSSFSDLTGAAQGSLILDGVDALFSNVTFANNQQSGAGAILATDSNLTFQECAFINNTGSQTGAVSLTGGTLEINDTMFVGNNGPQGGAVRTQNTTTVLVTDSTFEQNNATNGGGLYFNNCTESSVTNTNMNYNNATQQGGAIYEVGCPGQVRDSGFKHNRAANGAVLLDSASQYVVMDCNFTSNSASKGGAALQLQSAKKPGVRVGGNIFRTNVGNKGAGLFLSDIAGIVADNYFIGNKAVAFGGGMFRSTSQGTIGNNTFSQNYASKLGGAIYDAESAGNILQNIFSNNRAAEAIDIYRTGCSGSLVNNTGLTSSDVVQVNPQSGS
ncbi:hypothetical protein WJX73_000003 [Symbiochloris irregularis]|uniref:Right handed beta helix domain-containing protein n=1 Tax=Symbiochloris irregularis TaxID=706552 RepID=A0AAW1PGN3_9CHLO